LPNRGFSPARVPSVIWTKPKLPGCRKENKIRKLRTGRKGGVNQEKAALPWRLNTHNGSGGPGKGLFTPAKEDSKETGAKMSLDLMKTQTA